MPNEKELKEIINMLWGYLPAQQVKELEEDFPEMITKLKRIHLEVGHPEIRLCSECNTDAVWVRLTQFAGKHYYCEPHVQKQSDFYDEDSNDVVWRKL